MKHLIFFQNIVNFFDFQEKKSTINRRFRLLFCRQTFPSKNVFEELKKKQVISIPGTGGKFVEKRQD
jgi:hypothetical protein